LAQHGTILYGDESQERRRIHVTGDHQDLVRRVVCHFVDAKLAARRNLPNDGCAWLSRISFDDVAGTVTGPHVPEVVRDYSIRPGAMAQTLRLGGQGLAPVY
jgi:hypothetical protein